MSALNVFALCLLAGLLWLSFTGGAFIAAVWTYANFAQSTSNSAQTQLICFTLERLVKAGKRQKRLDKLRILYIINIHNIQG